jgi:hypothetical protein
VDVIDGGVISRIDDRDQVVLPPSVSSPGRPMRAGLPARMLAFFVLGEADSPTVTDWSRRVLAATRRPDWSAA